MRFVNSPSPFLFGEIRVGGLLFLISLDPYFVVSAESYFVLRSLSALQYHRGANGNNPN